MMEDFDAKNKALMARIDRAQNRITKLQEEKTALYKECPHTHIELKSSYFSGSYYDKAYTDYWNECSVCGAKSETTTKMSSYYG